MLGVTLLWAGWLGFNGGSVFALNASVGLTMLNTILAGCAGFASALARDWWRVGPAQVTSGMNGSLAGLVSVTAGCFAMTPLQALLVGAVGALVMLAMDAWIERQQIDDIVGAVSVHGAAGAWGTLAVGLLTDTELLGIGVAFAWAFGVPYVVFKRLNQVWPLRVSLEAER